MSEQPGSGGCRFYKGHQFSNKNNVIVCRDAAYLKWVMTDLSPDGFLEVKRRSRHRISFACQTFNKRCNIALWSKSAWWAV
jgi:hypothetical protein